MKLKSSFITQDVDGKQIMVCVSSAEFNGMVKSNATAAFIIDLLKTDTSREDIISAMLEKYDAPEERIASDVDMVISKLREINAIEE